MHVMSEGSKTLPKPMGQEPIGGKPAMGHPVPAAISRPKLEQPACLTTCKSHSQTPLSAKTA